MTLRSFWCGFVSMAWVLSSDLPRDAARLTFRTSPLQNEWQVVHGVRTNLIAKFTTSELTNLDGSVLWIKLHGIKSSLRAPVFALHSSSFAHTRPRLVHPYVITRDSPRCRNFPALYRQLGW